MKQEFFEKGMKFSKNFYIDQVWVAEADFDLYFLIWDLVQAVKGLHWGMIPHFTFSTREGRSSERWLICSLQFSQNYFAFANSQN